MSKDEHYGRDIDRYVTTDDIKNRLILLMENGFELPEVHIYDEPVRYLKINKQWAKILFGLVSWLEDPAGWKDAQDGNFEGIQQFLLFEEGIDLPEAFDCEDVEDCLETSDIIADIHDKLDGIEEGGSQSGNPNNTDKPPTEGSQHESGNEPAFTPDDCGDSDKDKLWGAIDVFVDYVHGTNVDFFQQIAVYASRAELVSTVISAIPLVGLLPFDEGIEVAVWLADYAGLEYNGSVTTEGLYQLKCDLFCEAVANGCYFDINTAGQYFLDNDGVPATVPTTSFEEFAGYLADGLTVTGNEVFCLMAGFQLAIASLGEKFGNATGMKAYTRAAQAGALSPNSEWQAWCEDCPVEDGDWVVILDFANDYVKEDEDEIVYRNAFNLLGDNTEGTQGGATVSAQYGRGLVYESVSSQVRIRQLNIANAGALFESFSINARRVSGTAAQFQIDADSNSFNNTPRNFGSTSFAWSSDAPVANVAGTPASIVRFSLRFAQVLASNTCTGEMRYIKFTGTGERPRFI